MMGGMVVNLKPGDVAQIHSYKHNHKIHRIWNKVRILYADDDLIICGNNKTRVIEATGRYWMTREPSICFFYKKYWFNIIGMLKKDGIHFYCNLSSPFVYDDEAIKYIDYDLDIRITPDMRYRILDADEYSQHKKKMNYPEKLAAIIDDQMKVLIDMIENRQGPFEKGTVLKWYNLYKELENL